MRNNKRKFKGSAFEAIHESAVALHKVGAIDSAVMQDGHDAIKPKSRSDLLDEARAAYVASFEQDHDPINPQMTARFEVLFSGITLGALTSC